FMKGIDVYGAEIKIGGFSGYLCELLVLQYKSFLNTLKAFADYKHRLIIDIERYYKNRETELKLLFKEPLVLIDPVDKARNVASAVKPQRLYTFIAAARQFLEAPSYSFFYPREIIPLSAEKLEEKLKKRGSSLLFVVFGKVKAVPDVLWGQLYKTLRSLERLLELHDFRILRASAWSNEDDLNVFIIELEQALLSPVKKHLGPPLEKTKECKQFIDKYVDNPITVCGPYIDEGRWITDIKRRHVNAAALLHAKLEDGGRHAGVAEQISHVLKKDFKILVNEEIAEIYSRNAKFAVFLNEFLSGMPKWLEPAKD
ncbi:hypothetical protein KEJ15_07655, partial [Candidatus Bathyarchaeota archaeon]|nr:hypothetical protein [Candidatus Bathyarchaeota archaeon]